MDLEDLPEIPNGWALLQYGEKEPHGHVMLFEEDSSDWSYTAGIMGRVHTTQDWCRIVIPVSAPRREW